MGFNRGEARERFLPVYEQLFKVWPKHQDFSGGFNALLDLVEEGFTDMQLLLDKATSYARNVDPANLQYVPLLRSWLKSRRFDDEDLFTDKAVATREWLRGCWQRADAKAVSDKYGFIYTHPPVPDDVQELVSWHEEQRRAWITQVALHVLENGPLPD